ncbi:MAG: hypothetical protein RLY16_1017 [Bacteroidota bacterium]
MQLTSNISISRSVSTKFLLQANLQNLLLLLSAICICCMFYLSTPQLPSIDSVDAAVASPLPESSSPVTNNGVAGTASPTSVSAIVTDALAFKAMLTTAQQATLQLTYTTTLARKWSNLPCGTGCRNGLQLGTNLTAAQYTAAMQIIKDVLSASANEGYDEFHQMNLAEAYLHANGGANGYDSTLRWIAFLNTPSATGAWMLQFGGHHYAANIAFNNGHVIGATPFFMGLEPKTFTYNSVAYDPLGGEKTAFANALASLSSTQLTTARLSSSFSDCVMSPGETNGGAASFPAYAMGQPLSSLTTAQQNLVLSIIQLYVGDMDADTYNAVMASYTNELSQTYISFRGSGTAGSASTFLVAQGDYVRISGPNVWIEFSCQGGVIISGQIHYHTIWRDRSHDYGVDLTGSPIDVLSVTPLNLISLDAVIENKLPVLHWTTENEINVSHFVIEQSSDASSGFQAIGTVNAKNLGIQTRYSFNSTVGLSTSTTFYRLKMMDRDGQITYSRIVTLRAAAPEKLTIVNTMVASDLQISYPSTYANSGFKIVNLQGQILLKGRLEAASTASSINIGNLPTGNYFIVVENGLSRLTAKFFKR